MVIKENDFIEVEYTATLEDGTVFDTTDGKKAKENGIFDEKFVYGSVIICIGQRHVLPKLDEFLVGKELMKDYDVALEPQDAFGKKSIERIRLVTSSTFKKHEINPYPGLSVQIDGEFGVVKHVSGGRIMVDFNHPFSGRKVSYGIKPLRKITDLKEKIEVLLNRVLNLKNTEIKVKDNNVKIKLPVELPDQLNEQMKKHFEKLTGAEIEFKGK